MKSILSKRKFALIAIFAICSAKLMALTAVASGNWSDAATWGGTTPGTMVNTTNISIPSGITVTLDQDVEFSGLLNTFAVNGSLNHTAATRLTINSGALTGTGSIDIDRLEFSGLFSSTTFSGTLKVNTLKSDNSDLSLASAVNIKDSLYLVDAGLSVATGANLTLENNSFVVMDNGSIATSGGVFNSGTNYSVIYKGGSQSTGIELNNSNLKVVYVDLENNTDELTLTNNLTVNTSLELNRGVFNISGRQVTFNGDINRTSNALLTSDLSSNIIIKNNINTDGFFFTSGSSVNNLTIDVTNSREASLGSDLRVGGTLNLMNGKLMIMNGSTLTMRNNSKIIVDNGKIELNSGIFDANGSYNVEYVGSADSTGVELENVSLRSVTVNLDSGENTLMLMDDIAVSGEFELMNGDFDLNGNDLELNGTLNQHSGTGIKGNSNSVLALNLDAVTNDTVWFSGNTSTLRDLEVNIAGGGMITLGSDLEITNELQLTSGKIDLADNDLHMASAASVTGYNNNRYILTSGEGKLEMHVTSSSAYVVFPIGTTDGYSPASIQQTSSGTTGKFMVNVMNGVYAQGTTGFNNASQFSLVDRTWMIDADSSLAVNMNLKLGWTAAAEVNGFNRNRAYITHYTNSKWDASVKKAATSGPNNTYEIERNGITSLSPFAVADSTSSLSIDAVAQTDYVINVYPNPAAEAVNVSVSDAGNPYVFELADFTGKIIMSSVHEGSLHTFNISDLSKGYYFIRAINPETNQMAVRQFMKY